MIIVLLGYMASGKSTIGKNLANILDYSFQDLDDFIEKSENLTVKDIFSSKGEIYFRKLESQALETLLKNNESLVLALGGGTPCYGNNLELLKRDNVVSVYLKSSIPTIVSRIEKEVSKRPLVAHLDNQDDLVEFIGKHLFERSQYYNKADFIVSTDNKSQKEISEAIISELF
jgi:shikimate kinase